MLLRESSQVLGQEVDVDAVIDRRRSTAGVDHGFPAAVELLEFASAANTAANPAMAPDTDRDRLVAELTTARDRLDEVVGPDGLMEAAATVAAFNGLVRVADGTGIELDDAMVVASSEVRSQLGLDAMTGAANTRRLGSDVDDTGIVPSNPDDPVRSLFADIDVD